MFAWFPHSFGIPVVAATYDESCQGQRAQDNPWSPYCWSRYRRKGASDDRILEHSLAVLKLCLPVMVTYLSCFWNCTSSFTSSGNLLTPEVLFFTPCKSLRCLKSLPGLLENLSSLPTDSTSKYVSFLAKQTHHYRRASILWPQQGEKQNGTVQFAKPQMSKISMALHLQRILQNKSDFY